MSRIAVAGLVTIETTLPVESFPIEYAPVRYLFGEIHSGVAGVGANVAIALTTLGHSVQLLGMLADDDPGRLARRSLRRRKVDDGHLLYKLSSTPLSVIASDPAGARSVFVDLAEIQEQRYPTPVATAAFATSDLAVLTNVEFSRPLLALAQRQGIPIATDVHAISDLDDPYNADFMAAADVLFQSHEALPCSPRDWITAVMGRYNPSVTVVGLGAEGALLGERIDGEVQVTQVPAVRVGPVVSSVGAGDALFAAFLHGRLNGLDPAAALRQAAMFAGHAVTAAGSSGGFVDATTLGLKAAHAAR